MRVDSRRGIESVAWMAIKLNKGMVALIDASDFERVSQHTWCAVWANYYWVARTWISGKNITLHRFVMNAQPGQEVDHKNGDGLDCRKSELRFATHSQNNCNAFRPGKLSQFKGVRPSGAKWNARIKIDGKQVSLGSFCTEEEAARAYDAKAKELHGEFAYLNFKEDAVCA